ncbi:MAG TPA: type IV pilus assembly protein PilM [Candidatus Magasanikbacteria bacterium]|nr:type IV pilus assembly protein PilM [Candidatus Magasanikbacteria bacterium]
MFANPFPNAFGLDIGDLSLKLVQLKRDGIRRGKPRFRLVNRRSIELPPGLIVNGELEKPEEVRKRILRLLAGNRYQKPIKSPWVVASLPETKSFIKLITIKKKSDDIVDDDIPQIAKKHIPFAENEESYIHYQVIRSSTETTEVLIGTTPKRIADSYTYLLESAGLGVISLEIEALALARTMITADKAYDGEARAILDIGAVRSSLIVYDHGVIQFSTSFPFSGELLTTAVSQELKIDPESAETRKKSSGLIYKKDTGAVWTILMKQTETLIKQITASVNFYYSHFPEANHVKKIILCGGGSNLAGLDKILATKLKISTRPGHPWKNLFSTQTLPDDPSSLNYATAIGLALRASENSFFPYQIF